MRFSISRFVVLATVAAVLCSCGGRVIPRDKLAHIYADMFLADQWLDGNPAARRVSDTTCVYEAILENYGYDADDYRASMNRYLDDPERFSKILRNSASILEKRMAELNREKKEIQARIPKEIFEFDFDRILVQTEEGWLRMADRDSLKYYRDTAKVLVFDPFYMDVAEKSRVENSPCLDWE